MIGITRSGVCAAAAAVLAVAAGCSSRPDASDTPRGAAGSASSESGDEHAGASSDNSTERAGASSDNGAERAGASSDSGGGRTGGSPQGSTDDPPPLRTTCGTSCKTDLDEARAALERDDFAGAFELYQCADTPEASFGAGLTRLLLTLEGQNADALMADYGEPPFSAKDVFGSQGIISRALERYNGSGELELTGFQNVTLEYKQLQFALDADLPGTGSGQLDALDATSTPMADVYLSWFVPSSAAPLTAGERMPMTFNCTGSSSARTGDSRLSWIDVDFESDGVRYNCNLPYTLPAAQCETDGGALVVNAVAARAGDLSSVTLDHVLFTCDAQDPETGETIPASTTDPEAVLIARISGTLSAQAVDEELDTSDLHPLLSDDASFSADQVPADRTVTNVVQHAAAVAMELEEAACFFQKAAKGSGTIATIPGTLYGGTDMPVSRGDTEVLASFTLLGAAAGRLASAFDIDMPLRDLVCHSDDGDGEADPGCPSYEAKTNAFNAAFGSGFRPEAFAPAKALLDVALPLLDHGMGQLDDQSLLVNDATSGPGLMVLRDIVQALGTSLESGSVDLPHLSPPLPVDLAAFFSAPRSPKDVTAPLLIWEETCDDIECSSSTEANPDFFEQYFSGSIDADWQDGEYEFSESEQSQVEATFEQFGRRVASYVAPAE
jgi:hypothetical protein